MDINKSYTVNWSNNVTFPCEQNEEINQRMEYRYLVTLPLMYFIRYHFGSINTTILPLDSIILIALYIIIKPYFCLFSLITQKCSSVSFPLSSWPSAPLRSSQLLAGTALRIMTTVQATACLDVGLNLLIFVLWWVLIILPFTDIICLIVLVCW